MNICILMKYWPIYGGVETVAKLLSNGFATYGHNVFIVYFVNTNYRIDCNMQNIKIYKLPNEKVVEFLHNFLIKQNINILINNKEDLLSFSKKACQGSSIKLINCLHDAFYYQQLSTNICKRILYRTFPILYKRYKIWKYICEQNKIYNQVDAYILLSQSYVEQYKRFVPNKNLERLFAIPNPLTYTINQSINLNKKEKKLLFVGRIIEWRKRISIIIELWKNIHNKYADWSLVIAGDGPDMQKTKELAKDLPRVQFEGFKEPKEYYEKASIFLMTSSVEGLPMTLLESSQFGCVPVVIDSFLSVMDIVSDGENGFITPNNDINAFTEKVCLLMDNQDLRESMARNGMKNIKKFSLENIVPQWEKLFKSLNDKE